MGLLFWKRALQVNLWTPVPIEVRLPAPDKTEQTMREERHTATMELLHASIVAEELSMQRTRLEIQRTELEIARLKKDG